MWGVDCQVKIGGGLESSGDRIPAPRAGLQEQPPLLQNCDAPVRIAVGSKLVSGAGEQAQVIILLAGGRLACVLVLQHYAQAPVLGDGRVNADL